MFNLFLLDNPMMPLYWLFVGFGLILIILVVTLAAIYAHNKRVDKRHLIGITLDTYNVKRKFETGEEFECIGLIVNAEYNVEPTSEGIINYEIVSAEELEEVKSKGELQGCYVVKPSLDTPGKKAVSVILKEKVAVYTIAVTGEAIQPVVEELAVEEPVAEEPVVEQPVVEEVVATEVEPVVEEVEPLPIIPIVEDSFDGRLRYDKSFTARVIQSDDEVKQWYTELKNELLAYAKVKSRMSWKRETFRAGRVTVAKISFRGKTMCLQLPLNAADFAESKYHVEDVSDMPSNADTPTLYRMKNARRVKYAKELIAIAMEQLNLIRVERIAEDYYMPYQGTVELIEKGLVKRMVKTAADEAIFLQNKTAEGDSN